MKKIIMVLSSLLAASLMLISSVASAANLWKCIATDARGATWYQYAPTRGGAASGARSRCRAGSYRRTCSVRCYPPAGRWRCVAADRQGKTWYWVSTSKRIAINNARTACIHNSAVGGCHVSPGSCSAS